MTILHNRAWFCFSQFRSQVPYLDSMLFFYKVRCGRCVFIYQLLSWCFSLNILCHGSSKEVSDTKDSCILTELCFETQAILMSSVLHVKGFGAHSSLTQYCSSWVVPGFPHQLQCFSKSCSETGVIINTCVKRFLSAQNGLGLIQHPIVLRKWSRKFALRSTH